MPVQGYLDGIQLRHIKLGQRIPRALSTHLAATTPYFNVVGGRVLLTGLVGLITTASGANSCQWVANPTTGTGTQVLCAALDINPALVGDTLTITGIVGDNMTYGAAGGLGTIGQPVVLLVGTLDFIAAAADGATSWVAFFIPLDDGGYMTAA